VVYQGAAGEAVLEHFKGLGHPCPEHYNPAGGWGVGAGGCHAWLSVFALLFPISPH